MFTSFVNSLMVLSYQSLQQAIRSRLFWILVFVMFFMLMSMHYLSSLSIFDHRRIILDLGLSTLHLLGQSLAIALPIQSWHQNIQTHRLYLILAKPVARSTVLLGHLTGILLAITALESCLTLLIAALLLLSQYSIPTSFFAAAYTQLLSHLITAFVAFFFIQFCTPLFSVALTLVVLFLSFGQHRFASYQPDTTNSTLEGYLTNALEQLLPKTYLLDLHQQAVDGLAVASHYLIHTSLYTTVYCTCLFGATMVIFQRKRFL